MIHRVTICYIIALTLLLELPSLEPEFIPGGESTAGYAHLITFTLLGFLVEWGRCKKSTLFWAGILIVYALGTEVLQGLLYPLCHRLFDVQDIVHNLFGVLFGTLIGHFCRPLVKKLTSDPNAPDNRP